MNVRHTTRYDQQAELCGTSCSEQGRAAFLSSPGDLPPLQNCKLPGLSCSQLSLRAQTRTRPAADAQPASAKWMGSARTAGDGKGRAHGGGGGRIQDTLVVDAAEREAGVGEAGEAIPVQPGPQGDVL